MSVYEVHLGSWRQGLSYRQLADELVAYVKELAFTHVEFLPVAEHPFGGSWGYQVTGYYAPTSRFGSPDDFRHLVDRLHQAGIGVIMDWVPAHFPKDSFALARFDGEALYEHPDPRRGEHPEWGTLVFDYGRNEVRNFLVANALYWLEEFHIDGLRVDAVASMLYLDYSRKDGEWEPNVHGGRENLEVVDFLKELNATAYKRVPGIVTIAEESTAYPGVTQPTHLGGLGFGLKWNMGWMHDSLGYVAEDPINRQYHHQQMTFSLVYAFSEQYVLPISHDEVVHGKGSLLRKMPGDRWQQLATLRAYLGYMWSHPGKQLLFMGSELGQEPEWSESRSLDWWLLDTPWHRGLHDLVGQLNRTYVDNRALWGDDFTPGGFQWLDADDYAQQRVRVAADGRGLQAGRVHHQLRRQPARDLPDRPAERGALARGPQHRRAGVRRLGRRQPRRRRGDRPARRTAGPPRPPCGCRRWRRSGSRPRTEPAGARTTGADRQRAPTGDGRGPPVGAGRSRSEQRVGQLDPGRGDARVLGADDLEQLEQAGADPGAVVAGGDADQVDEAGERVLDVAAEQVAVGDGQAGVDVARGRRRPRRRSPVMTASAGTADTRANSCAWARPALASASAGFSLSAWVKARTARSKSPASKASAASACSGGSGGSTGRLGRLARARRRRRCRSRRSARRPRAAGR